VAATVKPLPTNVPVEEMVHDTEAKITGAAGDWRKLQSPASARLNPKPVAATFVPTGPEVGESTT
jgi:hypothetical protein